MEDDDDDFEQFDAEGDELLAEDSDDEDSMQVVSMGAENPLLARLT